MNIDYYDKAVTFLMVAIYLFIFAFIIIIFVRQELYDKGKNRLSKISIIIGVILIIIGGVLLYLNNEYSEEYRKQCYEQCENYMKENYNVGIIEYDKLHRQNGSVYLRGGYAEIKTYSNEGYYVEYELNVLNNGIIQYQTAIIYDSGDF